MVCSNINSKLLVKYSNNIRFCRQKFIQYTISGTQTNCRTSRKQSKLPYVTQNQDVITIVSKWSNTSYLTLIRKALQRVHKRNSEIDRKLELGSIISDMGVGFWYHKGTNIRRQARSDWSNTHEIGAVLGSFVWSALIVCYVAYVFALLPERSQSAIMTSGCSPSRPSPFTVKTRGIVHIVDF